MHYNNIIIIVKSKMISLDGLACTMKTSILHKLASKYKCLFIDFTENINRMEVFKTKANNPKITLIYTMLQFAYTKDLYDFSDRSPITDLWYFIIYELVGFIEAAQNDFNRKFAYNRFVYDRLCEFLIPKEQLHLKNQDRVKVVLYENMFSKYKTLFIVPHLECVDIILEKMKERNNGIDVLKTNFIFAQIIFFNVLEQHFNYDNFMFIRPSVESLYTQNTFDDITGKLIEFYNEK